ncbi:hypothetical protein [Pseudomonas syringae]
MSWYKTGVVTVTQGSNTVIGTGTSFIANSRVGDAFRGPDGKWYEVINIASNTAMSIAPDYQGPTLASGSYALAPMQGYIKDSADALRAATQIIASGVSDMQEQVAAATEAAESAERSKATATEQAGIAGSAAEAATDNKNAALLAAQQSQGSAQASGEAAGRAESAKNSIIQSEQAAAASATEAEESAERAEAATVGKASSGDNNDIKSLRALTLDGFDRIRQGLAALVGATTGAAGVKGLVPAPSAGPLRFLSSLGTWLVVNTSTSWGAITGALSEQADLQNALSAKMDASLADFVYLYPNGTEAAPGTIAINTRLVVDNPFQGKPVFCIAEIVYNNIWGETGWIYNGGGYGVKAAQLPVTDKIVIQSGSSFVMTGSQNGGSPHGNSSNINAASQVRVKVWRLKG